MKHVLLLSACCLVLFLVTGCQRGGRDLADVAVELEIEPQPVRVGLATVRVALSDEAGQAIEGAQVEIEGNMSHAGMVPVFSAAREAAPGRYEAQLEFTMGGDWFIVVRVDLPDRRSLERTFDVRGVDISCLDTPE
ncbi:MAG TPA: FixH family protein, partial [Anaerolineae bacterium]|nr:FixH family protein [Anaerolineae bacterium]